MFPSSNENQISSSGFSSLESALVPEYNSRIVFVWTAWWNGSRSIRCTKHITIYLPSLFQKEIMSRNLSGMWPTVTALSPDLMWMAQQYELICLEACFDLFRFNCKSDFFIFHFIFQLWFEMRNYQSFCKNCVKRLILK